MQSCWGCYVDFGLLAGAPLDLWGRRQREGRCVDASDVDVDDGDVTARCRYAQLPLAKDIRPSTIDYRLSTDPPFVDARERARSASLRRHEATPVYKTFALRLIAATVI